MSENVEAVRADVVARYDELAQAAQAGRRLIDCGPQGYADGRFGASCYDDTTGLPEGAVRASMGCGDPVAVAGLRPGETVLDLGSGGGVDVLLSARRVGPTGTVYGLDASPKMIELAEANAAEAGADDVEFLHGCIEHIPLSDAGVDVVISNCVINLSADKPRVLSEAFRVLKPGGRLGVCDLIAEDGLDPAQRAEAEHLVGCPIGTLTEAEYRALLARAGFTTYTITRTHAATGGLHSAIIQAARPDAPPGILIRPMRETDAEQVLAVYQAGLDGGNASFETTAPTWEAFDAAKLPLHRHVAVDAVSGQVVGWVAVSAVSSRCVYAGVVEHSVYVHPDHGRRGVGLALLNALIQSTETEGIWTIQAGIFPENTASLRLHEKAGFRVVGTRHRIGCHHGRWRDVVFVERRSTVTGL
ncbi:GNAT family N-acetyltransferase [Thermostaphylospora chromogena]|uniref:Arsenite methyltransferase n=1 Tax=Thermostaphylospora chromogena TaxID=35622 RepID=A0A1H1DNF4_9ACTN|nr:GNAT family N-acetyltransferase [Thermostaphylospora chromogena]SDQ78061.1 L-amino acid N-acyltransferase YncA [Thermostaphylospora chromogena]